MTTTPHDAEPSLLVIIASETVGRHENTPGGTGIDPNCGLCTPSGCPVRDQAQQTVDAYRAARPVR